MLVTASTRLKVERVAAQLRDEFGHLPSHRVEQAIESVVDELLASARFDDFVPLLVHRRVSERLRSAGAAVLREAAAP
jgi:Protein of unknown function (DUF3562)